MIICPNCQNVLSDTKIIKAVSVIQINYEAQLVNCRCRKCKTWIERVPISDLIDIKLIKDM